MKWEHHWNYHLHPCQSAMASLWLGGDLQVITLSTQVSRESPTIGQNQHLRPNPLSTAVVEHWGVKQQPVCRTMTRQWLWLTCDLCHSGSIEVEFTEDDLNFPTKWQKCSPDDLSWPLTLAQTDKGGICLRHFLQGRRVWGSSHFPCTAWRGWTRETPQVPLQFELYPRSEHTFNFVLLSKIAEAIWGLFCSI